jgi:hypothetical protein
LLGRAQRWYVKTVPFCADRGQRPGRCVEFAEDVLEVGGYGARCHDEGASNFLVGAPFDDPAEDLQFARGEPVEICRR